MILSLGISAACVLPVIVGVIFSPSIYHWFANSTGYEGHKEFFRSVDATPDDLGPQISVRLDTNVMPGLDWQFRPEKSVVETHIGEPMTIYFEVVNRSKNTEVAHAIYNVTPDAAGYYFMKTQCFCFTEEKLKPGETARLPVVFYLDKDMLKDQETQGIRSITLSYTFFPKERTQAAISAARDLHEGSLAQLGEYAPGKQALFSADPSK